MKQYLIYQVIDWTLETCEPVFFSAKFLLVWKFLSVVKLEIKLEILCGLYCVAFFGFH